MLSDGSVSKCRHNLISFTKPSLSYVKTALELTWAGYKAVGFQLLSNQSIHKSTAALKMAS